MGNRTIQELEKTYLSDAAENEFDACIARFRRKQKIRWGVSCAASLFVAMIIGITIPTTGAQDTYAEISTLELMETINALTQNNLDEICNINAKPGKEGITVVAEFKNGITKTYLMKRGADGSSIELTAQNSK